MALEYLEDGSKENGDKPCRGASCTAEVQSNAAVQEA